MNKIVTTVMPDDENLGNELIDYQSMSDDQLEKECRKITIATVKGIVTLAKIYAVMVERNLQLPPVVISLMGVLRQINSGRIVPEMAFRVAQVSVRNKLSMLPLEDQRKIMDRGIEIAALTDRGIIKQHVPIENLTFQQASMVISERGVATIEEQSAKLQSKRIVSSRKPGLPHWLRMDKLKKQFVVEGHGPISFAMILAAIGS